jgi:membrane peptidoglycan carboxypeptidase
VPREAVRTWKPLWAISPRLRASVLAWEDPRFYHHAGVSPRYIADALLLDLREWRLARGGSTITQQLAKTLWLTPEKTVRRKLEDAVLAVRLERVLTKDEILETYLNSAFWGDRVYGAEAAARAYFKASADSLDWAQSAVLASMLPNPRRLNPCHDLVAATQRRNRVLGVLERLGSISPSDYRTAADTPMTLSCSMATASEHR